MCQCVPSLAHVPRDSNLITDRFVVSIVSCSSQIVLNSSSSLAYVQHSTASGVVVPIHTSAEHGAEDSVEKAAA